MADKSGPHEDNAVPHSLEGYFETDQYNLDQNRRLRPEFISLVPLLYKLYDRSADLIPRTSNPIFGRGLMLCNKAMLSAAAMIGRAHPDDAAAITRRAIEISTTMAAIKHRPANLDAWTATEARAARWQERQQGKRPRPFSPSIQWPDDQPLVDDLRRQLGVLSDVSVHFTPEYEIGQGWHHDFAGDQVEISLAFHCHDEREIRRELLVLAAIHYKILMLFDGCFDGAYVADLGWSGLRVQLLEAGAELGEQYLLSDQDDGATDA